MSMTKKVSHQLKISYSSFLVCSVENPFVLSFLYFLMAEFVKLSIFGTVFEVTTRFVIQTRGMWKRLQPHSNHFFNIRYVDLQPVGMGAFGLVWYDIMKRICFSSRMENCILKPSVRLVLPRINLPVPMSLSKRSWSLSVRLFCQRELTENSSFWRDLTTRMYEI
jgi:hypothetical protein